MLVNIYTDGACSSNPGPGGWAIAVYKHSSIDEFSGYKVHTTNNEMELTAFFEALFYICRNHKQFDTYNICSDSAYVVNAINKGWLLNWEKNNWKTSSGDDVKNKELWIDVLKLYRYIKSNFIEVTVTKVKGHSGNAFNDRVDCLATQQRDIAKKVGGDIE